MKRNIVVLSLCFAAFVLGAVMHRYTYVPYPQGRDLIKATVLAVKRRLAPPDKALSRQYSSDQEKLPLGRDVETALLPLKLRGVRLSDHLAVPKVAGGITAIGHSVVVLDRLGNLYVWERQKSRVDRLPFPPIPNNIKDYLGSALVLSSEEQPTTLTDYTFRAYDVAYMAHSGRLAVSHEYFDRQLGKSRLAVSTIEIDERPVLPKGSWETIFLGDPLPGIPTTQGGGQLVASDNGRILALSIGDHGMDTKAQDKNSRFGKIVQIAVNTRQHKILGIGFRNPQGLAATSTGDLLATDHGPLGGDELNLIVEGANYGWPNVTLGTDYSTYTYHRLRDKDAVGEHTGFAPPLFAWIPSVGVSSVIQVKGFHRRWDGDILVGSLKATSLFRLRFEQSRVQSQSLVQYVEQIWVGQRIRDIAQTEDGAIILWTDDAQLLSLSVDQQLLARNKRHGLSNEDPLASSPCMHCHHFGPTSPADPAPTLSNLFTRRIASDSFRYSAALRSKEGVWTEDKLRQFLAAPNVFASGTSMMNNNLRPAEIEAIIKSLKAHRDD